MMLHISFIIIFIGGMVTALTSKKGIIHLRQNTPTTEYVNRQMHIDNLPFLIRLDTFRVARYPGTDTPSDYISRLTIIQNGGQPAIKTTVSMNKIHTHAGYRFCQSSYDDDWRGTWLTVNYDPFGTTITYIGFLILTISFVSLLFTQKSTFRRLLRHPLLHKTTLILILLTTTNVANAKLPVVNRTQADSLAKIQVVYSGRIVPFNTQAKHFLQKIYGKTHFHGLTPEQVVCSWQLNPQAWDTVAIIRIKNPQLRTQLGLTDQYASLTDLFDKHQYRLQPLWQQHQSTGNKMEKAIRETDEKVGLILMLKQGTLIQRLTPDIQPAPTTKIQAELIYNHIPFCKILFMFNLLAGIIATIHTIANLFKQQTHPPRVRRAWLLLILTSTLFLLFGYTLRAYISGRLPLSNGYETMEFAALAVLLATSLLHNRYTLAAPFGLILSGFIMLVAYLGEMNPQITPLMPVLQSPWLSFHVSTIMIAYALYALIFLNAIAALTLSIHPTNHNKQHIRQLTLLSRIMLYPATTLLGIGIILGAVWANVSWGSYWSWDPKEVWALATFMIYAIPLHRTTNPMQHTRIFHTYMITAFMFVLMTYFGVNYLLGGMHSYAG